MYLDLTLRDSPMDSVRALSRLGSLNLRIPIEPFSTSSSSTKFELPSEAKPRLNTERGHVVARTFLLHPEGSRLPAKSP